jgi:hypothetical protein
LEKSDEAFHENGLAAAARADDEVAFATLQLGAYVVEDHIAVKRFSYVVYFYHCNSKAAST